MRPSTNFIATGKKRSMSQSNRRLVIAMPIRKDRLLRIETAAFCAAALARQGLPAEGIDRVTWVYVPSDFCELGRNAMIQEQIEIGFEWLFFLDSDTVPFIGALRHLIALSLHHVTGNHRAVVSGLVPMDIDGRRLWNVWAKDDDDYLPRDAELPDEPFECHRLGGAALLVPREVFSHPEVHWPWFRTQFRPMTPKDRHCIELTDDEWFSDQVRQAGLELWADPDVICAHFSS